MSARERHDFGDVRGQDDALITCAIAVRDRRNVILMGPPGTGKTMIARRLVSLLPALTDHERAWLTAEYHGANLHTDYLGALITERPFRAPHHTISQAALVGSGWMFSRADGNGAPCRCRKAQGDHLFHELPKGIVGRAGEVDLARFGVLMLDELPEFARTSVEALASTLRKMGDTAPLVVATANACPCGWSGETVRQCSCSANAHTSYTARVDRYAAILGIDLVAAVAPVSLDNLRDRPRGTLTTAVLRERIAGGAL